MDKSGMTLNFIKSKHPLTQRLLRLTSDLNGLPIDYRCCVIHGILFLLIAVLPLQACKAEFTYKKQVDAVVLAEMKRQQIVGAAIGIIQKSKIVYTRGYGWSDLQTRTPATDETIFNWASNSKPLIAITALQLSQVGKLDLDKSIDSYLPELPAQISPVTCRQLLCHQSGIPHYSNGRVIPLQRRAEPATHINPLDELDPRKSLARFISSPLLFEPGMKTSYSSYAYVLLTAVVQAAGKEPIDVQLKDRIINPLKLTSFQLDLPINQQANWTMAYKIEDGNPALVSDYAHFWKHGAGGYKSNIKDFASFATALTNSSLIAPSLSTKMWTQQRTRDGNKSIYGLGIVVTGSGPAIKVSHSGSQDETRTRLVTYPHQGHGIVVMCNTQGSDPKAITTAIYSALTKPNSARVDGVQSKGLQSTESQTE